ncbi:Uu.00g122190.m01.CDS01 [Anthostomella pinea]|uniref:Uu.00g122190.m01.CDS01 n=1 Tax=Anthostomella pinea TaxID=933095 RepID=A0AAI8VI45_9PEZI|nr:Uu.00g122190.m01.CDS01 [Anthostomella pinea]
MCIILLSTAHPRYALIAIDNRDEYVLRPTSRPHWWTHRPSGNRILSARDLHRRERGTWMGVGKDGRFAVLTNYRESAVDDPDHAICGVRSRGGMVTAWLGAPAEDSLDDFIKHMLDDKSVKGVGGFSLICGDLKAKAKNGVEPLVIISNRCNHPGEVPRIGGERGKTYGLSNTVYEEPATWPKIKTGKKLLEETIQEAVDKDLSEDELTERLFSVLENDTLPVEPKMSMQEHMDALRQSVYIRAFGDEQEWKDMADAADNGKAKDAFDEIEDESESEERLRTEAVVNFMKGAYGTQRQTLVLVDWEGNVTYAERALWDAHGNPVEKGKGDRVIRYKIDGMNT